MIWKVKAKPGGSVIRGLIRDRLRSFALVVSTGIILLASLIVSAVISAIKTFMKDQLYELPAYLSNFTSSAVSFVIIYLMFMAVYKILPDVHLKWKSVWIGALVTTVLFTLGKYLIGLYLGTSTFGSTYGAAGSLVILLLWIYYSSQILFLGAEFTQVYANRYGEGIVPRSNFEKYADEGAVAELPEKEHEEAVVEIPEKEPPEDDAG
jgi:membrane protein